MLIEERKLKNSEITLDKICQATKFSYGEIWLCSNENDFLELSPDYCIIADRHQLDLELFRECSEGFIMSKGEGLPGHVLQSGESEWMLDVSIESEDSFLRNKIAGICGVKTGFALPVIEEKKVLMVMAFFTCDLRPYSAECTTLATDLATHLTSKAGLNENLSN